MISSVEPLIIAGIWLSPRSDWSRTKFSLPLFPPHVTREKPSHKNRVGLILPLPSSTPPSPALLFPRCSHLVMVGAELRMNSVTVPDHPSQLIGLVAAGLVPRWGELYADGIYAWETREPWGLDNYGPCLCNSHSTSINSLEHEKGCDLTSLPQTLVWPHLERQPASRDGRLL